MRDKYDVEVTNPQIRYNQDDFMKELSDNMSPGTSALFVLIRKATVDKVLDELHGSGGKVLKTSLSHEDEAKLQAAIQAAK